MTAVAPAFRLFRVEVRAVTRLTPSFVRITFTGPELAGFADNGDDQRISLVLPGPDGEPLAPPAGLGLTGIGLTGIDDGWYAHWLALPEHRRNPLRTYTVRRARPEMCEVDVDFVLHGDTGPATRWAGSVAVGARAQLVGPNRAHAGSTRAKGWNPPAGTPTLLIAGDETAVPAVAAILEGLPPAARGTVLVEVPGPDDVLPLRAPDGVRIQWVPRGGSDHGVLLAAAVRRAAGELLAGRGPAPDVDVDVDVDLDDAGEIWDVPEEPAGAPVYAWLAGEAGCIASLRRHLVKELGLDRRSVAFMGYWRYGVARVND